jgi:2-C-methyl-D-erythritol 2,4-cyclodiphosphate synthase
MDNIRTGIGYDLHPLAASRRLLLGGVEIPFERGLDGCSDADALTHAVIDALLGAAGLGDIGSHFPPGDERYRGISSIELLQRTAGLLAERGWRVVNIDSTIVAEKPRMQEYIEPMRERLAQALGVPAGRVSVKASTANSLGPIGRGEGIAAHAVALIQGGKK